MQRGIKAVVLLAAVALGLPGTGRADYFSYTQENGNTGFADDLRQVPARYRNRAVRHADKPLADYPRLTESEPVRPAARIGRRAPEAPVAGPTVVAVPLDELLAQGQEDRAIFIEVAPGVNVPVSNDGSGPVRVDRHVPRWVDGRYTYFTIVTRGEWLISEIEEPSR
jgi:hypothetical protein